MGLSRKPASFSSARRMSARRSSAIEDEGHDLGLGPGQPFGGVGRAGGREARPGPSPSRDRPARPGPAGIRKRRLVDGRVAQGQVEQMEGLLDGRKLGEGLGIEIAFLGPNVQALAGDFDLDLVEGPVPGLPDAVAQDVVAPGHGLQVGQIAFVLVDVPEVAAARVFGQLGQGVEAGDALVLEDGVGSSGRRRPR